MIPLIKIPPLTYFHRETGRQLPVAATTRLPVTATIRRSGFCLGDIEWWVYQDEEVNRMHMQEVST